MAELESKRGKQIHVLDDEGRIVIGIGQWPPRFPERARAARDRLRSMSATAPCSSSSMVWVRRQEGTRSRARRHLADGGKPLKKEFLLRRVWLTDRPWPSPAR
jgi:hypothetical protein